MKSIIQEKQSGSFIALETDTLDRIKLQCLGTEVMQWSGDIWILDVSAFKKYWEKQGASKGMGLIAVWRKVLNHVFGTTPSTSGKVISFTPAYRAVSAHNPWMAVLLLNQMKIRDSWGLIAENSRSGVSLLKEMNWDSWWMAIDQVENHYQQNKFKGFKKPLFRRQCHRLQLAVNRLVFKMPGDMRILNYDGMKNRFGIMLARLWRLTYGPVGKHFQTDFPWKSWQFHFNPFVKSDMDYPLFDWQQMESVLISDLDRLSKKLEHSGERITRIEWQLNLVDMTVLEIPIRFRNPHNLYLERGQHTTALLQAQYGFKDCMEKLLEKQKDELLDFGKQAITSWSLKVSKSMVLQPVIMDIFGEILQKDSDRETLLQMENELPVTLNQYQNLCDWVPDDSYISSRKIDDSAPEKHFSLGMEGLLRVAAEQKPLYILNSPKPCPKPLASRTVFIESCPGKWWKKGDTGDFERNYYRSIDPEGRAIWVFSDNHGKWYQHGIFG